MIRSIGSGSLVSDSQSLNFDNNSNYSPSTTTTPSPSEIEPARAGRGFQITSRPNSYKPPVAVSLPSSPPSIATPLPRHSLSLNASGSSSLRSRRGSPPAPFRINSNESYMDRSAVTTHTLSSSIDASGRRMVNQYVRLKTIGQGSHGKVWLCAEPSEEEEDEELKYCAIKSVAREGKGKSLRYAKGKQVSGGGIGEDETVKREVAIMKRLDHRNVVRLKEVIDDVKSKKVFMVLEFMAGGQIVWQDENKNPAMTVDEARRTFRDVVLGLEYLHYQGIIHRDIKPANLLWTEDHDLVKISDFGVSHVSDALLRATPGAGAGADDQALRMTAGSPAFFAPELCHSTESSITPELIHHDDRDGSYFGKTFSNSQSDSSNGGTPSQSTPYIISKPLKLSKTKMVRPGIGKAIDVWALGVTLYCLLFGDTPFMARTEYELYNVIVRQGIPIGQRMGKEGAWTGVGEGWTGSGDGKEGGEAIDLLAGLLHKDPTKRITLEQVKNHPWVLRNLDDPKAWLSDTDPTQAGTPLVVTEEDVSRATQERGTGEQIPRIRPGLRRALNAAFDRFPAFRKKNSINTQPSSPRSRSKSNSSNGHSLPDSSENAGSERVSREPSDAAIGRSRKSIDVHEPGALSPPREPSSIQSSPALGQGHGLGRWGSWNGKKEPSLSRSTSIQSFAGINFHNLLPSRKNSHREARESGYDSAATSFSRTSSPFPTETETKHSGRRPLNSIFSRFGRKSAPTSSTDDGTLAAEIESSLAIDTAAYSSRKSVVPKESDEVLDSTEFEYSSEDMDEDSLESPEGQADNVNGWTSTYSAFGVGWKEGNAFGIESTGKLDPGTNSLDLTPKASAHHSTRLDPNPSSILPPLIRQQSDTPSKNSKGSNGNNRDGSIKSSQEGNNGRRWAVHTNAEEEEEEDDGEEIFVSSRRKRTVT